MLEDEALYGRQDPITLIGTLDAFRLAAFQMQAHDPDKGGGIGIATVVEKV
ncbi:MAG: hypothetical protein ABII06_22455 [Pseudomonadota bacterium]